MRNLDILEKALKVYKIDSVLNFVSLKAVRESVEKPVEYYDNNVNECISLLKARQANNIKL